MMQGDLDSAFKRVELVMTEHLPRYNKDDRHGIYHMIMPLIRAIHYHGDTKLRAMVKSKLVEEYFTEETFEGGPLKRALTVLLTEEDKYVNADLESDIETALSANFSQFLEHVYVSQIGWSMKSLVSELCLCLAQKLDQGNGSRDRLLQRGLILSSETSDLCDLLAHDGRIVHMMACQAHQPIHARILALTKDDMEVKSESIVDVKSGKQMNGLVIVKKSSRIKTLLPRRPTKDEPGSATVGFSNLVVKTSITTHSDTVSVDSKRSSRVSWAGSSEASTGSHKKPHVSRESVGSEACE